MGARQILAHAICETWGRDCACSRDPWEPACDWLARKADVILQWPADRRMRLIHAIAAGECTSAAPALHERLAAAGQTPPVPDSEPRPSEPGPTLNLATPAEGAGADDELSDEQEMRRAAGRAWRA